MIPKLNKIISDSRAYVVLLPGISLDASLQSEPIVDQNYMGFRMTGLFGPVNGSDLDPNALEKNLTEPANMTFVNDPAGGNLQLYMHQISLNSILASYMKSNTLSSWMLSKDASDEDRTTTTGLNEVFIEYPVIVMVPPTP
jgi:hypothetical protein